jgi:mRNA interferase MazF
VYLVALDPTVGAEIQKTRPCLIISPDEMNQHIRTVIIAPMTTRGTHYPTRVFCEFEGRRGQIVLDQIRTVDTSRLVRSLGRIDEATQQEVLSVLREMFAP